MRKDIHTTRGQPGGFTIVELLIATVIFSVVLLVVTEGVMQVDNSYIKGVTNSSTQSVANNVLNIIGQGIQFDSGAVSPTTAVTPGSAGYFCIGNQQFSYWPGYELVNGTAQTSLHQTNYSLIENNTGSCGPTASTSGTELLSPFMRLTNFKVTCLTTPSAACSTDASGLEYEITLQIDFGADDLLSSPPTASNAVCLGQTGEQFCSSVALSKIIVKRVQ